MYAVHALAHYMQTSIKSDNKSCSHKTHYVKRASLLLKTARLTPSERLSAILSTKHTP